MSRKVAFFCETCSKQNDHQQHAQAVCARAGVLTSDGRHAAAACERRASGSNHGQITSESSPVHPLSTLQSRETWDYYSRLLESR